MGPTASGKSDLALRLQEQLNVRIISVDSALVYRGMDIGTAKPSKEILSKVPHDLVDICDPSDIYSAGRFYDDVLQCIQKAFDRGELPLLVGGTFMYFKRLQEGVASLPPRDDSIRASIDDQAKVHGWEHLHKALIEIDPKLAAHIHPNDKQRIQRGLEIAMITHKPPSDHWKESLPESGYQFLNMALVPKNRALLHERIEKRMVHMVESGFLEEVEYFFNQCHFHDQLPSMRLVGYRQFWSYLKGECSMDEAIYRSIVATRQLAKRQLTWLRSWPNLQSFYLEEDGYIPVKALIEDAMNRWHNLGE